MKSDNLNFVKKNKKKIVLLTDGTRFKVIKKIIKLDMEIISVIIPNKENNQGLYQFLLSKNIDCKMVYKNEEADYIDLLSYDILLSYGYPFLLSERIVCNNKLNLNLHPTLLPKYRGIGACNYALRRGDKEIGVSIHLLDKGIDTGDILLQKKRELGIFDNVKTMNIKLRELEFEAIKELINLKSYTFTKQDVNFEKTKTRLLPKDSEIPGNLFSIKLYNHLRSCDNKRFPAFVFINGKKFYIKIFQHDGKDEEIAKPDLKR